VTWTLSLTGHVDSKEKEQEVLEDLKEFLEDFGPRSGLLSGQFNGIFGTESLTPQPKAG
jgi:hypothetical protein